MEPDFDKLVSNKIRQAEKQLVSWNKQNVWQKVQSETNAERRSYYFHYAAAALILLLVCFGVQLILDDVKPQLTDAKKKISAREAIEPEKKSVIQEKTQKPLPDETAQNPENDAAVQARDIPNRLRKTVSSAKQETKDVDAGIEPVVTDIEIEDKEFLLPPEVTVHEEKIRPIVGVITESYSEDIANVKRKKSLRKLESPSPIPWENIPNALVFARKNNH
jgi:hypothetical protein